MQQDVLESPQRGAIDTLARGALRWLADNVELFTPLGGTDEREDAEKHKAFIELALLVWRLRRTTSLADNPELERLLEFVAGLFAIETFRERLMRVDDLFVTYALLYTVMRDAGRVYGQVELRRMQRFVDNSTVEVSERSPHRVLEVRQVLDAARLRHSFPPFDALASRTILAQPISLVRATEHDAYSITHDIFYLSDWGCTHVRGLSSETLQRTKRTVDELLGMHVYARHWDLVGELLLAAQFLGDTSSDFYRCGRRALEDAQLADGVVPGPTFNEAEAAVPDEDARREYVFKECYHPTLVAALVGALCDD